MPPSYWTDPVEPATPLAAAMRRSRLRGGKLDDALKKHGIDRAALRSYATGRRTPAPWLARAIADMFGGAVEDLFPAKLVED
jgi:hypothetical protein